MGVKVKTVAVTTINLPPALKQRAKDEGINFTETLVEGLKRRIAEKEAPQG